MCSVEENPIHTHYTLHALVYESHQQAKALGYQYEKETKRWLKRRVDAIYLHLELIRPKFSIQILETGKIYHPKR